MGCGSMGLLAWLGKMLFGERRLRVASCARFHCALCCFFLFGRAYDLLDRALRLSSDFGAASEAIFLGSGDGHPKYPLLEPLLPPVISGLRSVPSFS
jgi:hypothetical protein